MSNFSTSPLIEDSLFSEVQTFIEKNTGIYISNTRKYLLDDRFASIIRKEGYSNFAEYFMLIQKESHNLESEIYQQFKDIVSTHETSFFRYPSQMDIFRETILPNYVKNIEGARNKTLRIVSLGCSTGEEPYTIAMLIAELLSSELSSWDIHIFATDMSAKVVKQAQEGIYSEYTVRNMPEIYRKYFVVQDKKYSIKEEIKQMVYFDVLNLKDCLSDTSTIPTCDMIFCRNVLIYFKEDLVQQLVKIFYDKLVRGGIFFVGHSENIRATTVDFTPYIEGERMIYIKE